ncbi:MAG: hypothetical protein Alpg2KO_00980 [Alphaproteobacteria bacterium]
MAVRLDPAGLARGLRAVGSRSMPFVATGMLNDLGVMARGDLAEEAEGVFDSPRPFSTRQAFYQVFARWRDASPEAVVGVKDAQAGYYRYAVAGGPRREGPGMTAAGAFVPVEARVNKYGNLPLGPKRWLARELGKPKVFSREVRGKRMVFQALKSRLKLLGVFVKAPVYERRFDFDGVVRRRVEVSAERVFDARVAAEVARGLRG